ncbi:hypothetical protein ACEPAH_2568 [Sanghuangporus vaninii]
MGRLKPPSSYHPPYAGNRRHHRRNNASESPPPAKERLSAVRATSPKQDSQSISKAYRDSQVQACKTMHVCSRPPSTPPGVYTPKVQSPTRSTSPLLRGRDLQYAVQDGYLPILECLKAHLGNAQASQLDKGDATSDSPISAAVRQIQECRRPARASALIIGGLLQNIDQHELGSEEVRNVFFMMCINMFARNSLDNIAELSREFQCFSILVQEKILQGSDFIRAAETLRDKGHYNGCKLFVKLALDDSKTKLLENEITILTNIISNLPDKGKQKAA